MAEGGLQHQPAAKKQLAELLARWIAQIEAAQRLRVNVNCGAGLGARDGLNTEE